MSELFSSAVSVQNAECFQRFQAAVSSGSYSGFVSLGRGRDVMIHGGHLSPLFS